MCNSTIEESFADEKDQHFLIEEVSFPSLFCVEWRIQTKDWIIPLKYSKICKLKLRYCDSQNVSQMSSSSVKIYKWNRYKTEHGYHYIGKKTGGKTYAGGEVLNEEVVDSMLKVDDGYKFVRTLRVSPPYWEAAKKELFAMIRQLGLPTWFISLSAAETHWADLLISWGKFVDNVDYTQKKGKNFMWETNNRLVRSDPVTVARFCITELR